MIFFDASTRTRNSFETGMTQLGGHAIYLSPDKMQISHGENAKDTANVLSRYGEAIAIRHCAFGEGNRYLREVAEHASVPVLNMQCDVYHPWISDLIRPEHWPGPRVSRSGRVDLGANRCARCRSREPDPAAAAPASTSLAYRRVRLMPSIEEQARLNAGQAAPTTISRRRTRSRRRRRRAQVVGALMTTTQRRSA
jgi:hypothetical protein